MNTINKIFIPTLWGVFGFVFVLGTSVLALENNEIILIEDHFSPLYGTSETDDIIVEANIEPIQLVGENNFIIEREHELAVCGNGIIEGNETCDKNNFAGSSCQAYGFAGGTLICSSDCTQVIQSNCVSISEPEIIILTSTDGPSGTGGDGYLEENPTWGSGGRDPIVTDSFKPSAPTESPNPTSLQTNAPTNTPIAEPLESRGPILSVTGIPVVSPVPTLDFIPPVNNDNNEIPNPLGSDNTNNQNINNFEDSSSESFKNAAEEGYRQDIFIGGYDEEFFKNAGENEYKEGIFAIEGYANDMDMDSECVESSNDSSSFWKSCWTCFTFGFIFGTIFGIVLFFLFWRKRKNDENKPQ